MSWAIAMEIAPAALIVILALLVPSGCLRDVLVGLPLLILLVRTIRHRPSTRVCQPLTTI